MLHSSFSWSFIRRIRPRGRWTGFSYRPFSIITFRGTTFSISNRFTCLLCAGPSPTSSCYSELLIISNLIFITFRVITYLHIWTNKILVNVFTTRLPINWMVTETWFIFQYIPLGLPGGLRARIPLLATFMIGAKLHSCSPPNDFRNENSRFSPLPIFSFTLSPKSWILIRLSRKNDTFKSFLV